MAAGLKAVEGGLTSQLTTAGRVVIMLSVLVGRIEPLTLALAMGRGKMEEGDILLVIGEEEDIERLSRGE